MAAAIGIMFSVKEFKFDLYNIDDYHVILECLVLTKIQINNIKLIFIPDGTPFRKIVNINECVKKFKFTEEFKYEVFYNHNIQDENYLPFYIIN